MVHSDSGGRQQQFSCDLHGDGTDSKPSARVYPETQQWFCFACGTSRDAIQTVRDKEGLDFRTACDVLEKRYHLPPLPWVEGDEEGTPSAPSKGWEEALEAPIATAEDGRARVAALLKGATSEKALTLNATLRLWEEYDRLVLLLEKDPDLLDEFLDLKAKVVVRLQKAQMM